MVPLVLTFVGGDRPGLVNAISEKIAACGATWLESRSARLAGKFAGILLVSVPDDRAAELQSSLRLLETAGLRLTVEQGASTEAEKPPGRLVKLDLLGHERPGLVRDVTQVLASLGVNIEEFASDLESAPFTGAEMFRASAHLRAPYGLGVEDLRKALERLAGEIMVDLAVADDEALD
ncbi:MAG TPA: ACT domain-containing protein [Roseiarcus sp.]|nr:ACT domain-containing protein [Roseiarcus sp.]